MAKSAGRRSADREAGALQTDGVTSTLSPEDAERAATAFVPLWKLDEAPFEAGGRLQEADLSALASPVAVELAAGPALRAAEGPLPVSSAAATITSGGMSSLSQAAAELSPASGLHQPLPERDADPALPSVMVEESVLPPVVVEAVVLAPAVVVGPAVVVEPEPALPARSARPTRTSRPPPRPVQDEPRTDPAIARRVAAAATARRDTSDDAPGYAVPKSKTPLMVGVGAVLLVGAAGAYFAFGGTSSGPSTPPAPSAHRSTTASPPQDRGAPVIPPPPPADEPAATAAPPPPAAVTKPAQAAQPAQAAVSPAPEPRQAAAATPPPPPPVAAQPTPPSTPRPSSHGGSSGGASRPSTPKPSTPSSSPGSIVRDNPF